VAASGLALALAHELRFACALAGAVGEVPVASLGAVPSARRVAAAARAGGLPATASGRLVWLADRRAAMGPADAADQAAAMSAELGRCATAAGAPSAVAIPSARTAAVDRVLAWHDAIVVVVEPELAESILERALVGLRALGVPVATMTPPARGAGALAAAGLRAPREARQAVAALELGRAERRDA